jgi:hypothetical protein
LRKSERLRIAEMEILRLSLELEYIKAMIAALVDSDVSKVADLDAGKWYAKKPNRPDIPNN